LFVAVIGFNVGGLAGVLATMCGTLLPSTMLALAAGRYRQRHHESRAVRAFTTGLAPLTIGLLLASGWILLEPARTASPSLLGMPLPSVLLVTLTVVVMLRSKLSPLWLIGLGAGLGVMGWV
jgi:chromate transporter